jgi:hypothetical protein
MSIAQTVENRYNGQVRYLRRNYGLGHAHIVNGEKKVGVTTITGQFEKAGLPQWSANLAAEEAMRLLREGTFTDTEVYNQARFKHIQERDDAAEGGTAAHDWIEKYLKDQLLDEHYFETDKSVGIVDAFLEWEKFYDPKNHIAEKNVISMALDYCGTRDDRPLIDGFITTLDFKTGSPDAEYNERKNPITKRAYGYTGKVRARDTHFMQCAGYDIADGEETGEYSEAYAVLYLPSNPEKFCKKIGIPTQRYFYFVTFEVDYWRERFILAKKYYDLGNEFVGRKYNPFSLYPNSTQLTLEGVEK